MQSMTCGWTCNGNALLVTYACASTKKKLTHSAQVPEDDVSTEETEQHLDLRVESLECHDRSACSCSARAGVRGTAAKSLTLAGEGTRRTSCACRVPAQCVFETTTYHVSTQITLQWRS